MKCPKLKFFRQFPGAEEQPIFGDCLQEECAWWDSELGRCDPTGLIRPLIRLVQALEEIRDKIPHAGQFVK